MLAPGRDGTQERKLGPLERGGTLAGAEAAGKVSEATARR